MSAIGSLVFCIDCGNLLESSTGDAKTVLVCDCCGAHNQGMQYQRCPASEKTDPF
jgi:DNA-directed RNA polymerase I subunit RPA12